MLNCVLSKIRFRILLVQYFCGRSGNNLLLLFTVRCNMLKSGLCDRRVLESQLITLFKYWFAAVFVASTQQLTSLEFVNKCCILALIC